MTQPKYTTHEPEGAYFSTCIEINVRSAEECGGASAPTPAPPAGCDLNASCTLHGVASSCGNRIDWVMENWGWSRKDAAEQVANECQVCKACSDSSTTETT